MTAHSHWLTTGQVANLTGLERCTVRARVRRGEIPIAGKQGNDLRYNPKDIRAYLLDQYKPTQLGDWGAWFSGFVDGEGSFLIQKLHKGITYIPCFSISQRIEQTAVIQEIVKHLNCGGININPRTYHNKYGYTSSPAVHFYVHNLAGCMKIKEVITAFPLHTLKAEDFAIWSEFIDFKATLPRYNKRPEDVEKMEWYFHRIQEVRKERKIQ